jgi:hypothetical protein
MTLQPNRQRRKRLVRGAHGWLLALACLTASCSRSGDATPTLAAQPPAAAAATSAAGTVPHGDHNPHYGGIVLMNGDEHFEVVASRDGACRVYFSDATRAELPAATASEVTVTISQKGEEPDVVALHIDDSGESWIGRGRPVRDPMAANLRVAYTSHGKPYFIDVPFPH